MFLKYLQLSQEALVCKGLCLFKVSGRQMEGSNCKQTTIQRWGLSHTHLELRLKSRTLRLQLPFFLAAQRSLLTPSKTHPLTTQTLAFIYVAGEWTPGGVRGWEDLPFKSHVWTPLVIQMHLLPTMKRYKLGLKTFSVGAAGCLGVRIVFGFMRILRICLLTSYKCYKTL